MTVMINGQRSNQMLGEALETLKLAKAQGRLNDLEVVNGRIQVASLGHRLVSHFLDHFRSADSKQQRIAEMHRTVLSQFLHSARESLGEAAHKQAFDMVMSGGELAPEEVREYKAQFEAGQIPDAAVLDRLLHRISVTIVSEDFAGLGQLQDLLRAVRSGEAVDSANTIEALRGHQQRLEQKVGEIQLRQQVLAAARQQMHEHAASMPQEVMSAELMRHNEQLEAHLQQREQRSTELLKAVKLAIDDLFHRPIAIAPLRQEEGMDAEALQRPEGYGFFKPPTNLSTPAPAVLEATPAPSEPSAAPVVLEATPAATTTLTEHAEKLGTDLPPPQLATQAARGIASDESHIGQFRPAINSLSVTLQAALAPINTLIATEGLSTEARSLLLSLIDDLKRESTLDDSSADALDLNDTDRGSGVAHRQSHDAWKHAGEKGLPMPRPAVDEAIPSLQAVAAYLKGRFRHLEGELKSRSVTDPLIVAWQKTHPLTRDYEVLIKPHRTEALNAIQMRLRDEGSAINRRLEVAKAACSNRSIDVAAPGQVCLTPERPTFEINHAVVKLRIPAQGDKNIFKTIFDELVLPLDGQGKAQELENLSAQRAHEMFGETDEDAIRQFEAIAGDATRNSDSLARLVSSTKLRETYENVVKELLHEHPELKPLTSESESGNAVSNTQLSSEATARWEYLYLGNFTSQLKEIAQKYHRAAEPTAKERYLNAFQLHGASVTRRVANLLRSLELSVKALTSEKLLNGLDPIDQSLLLSIADQKSRIFEWALNPSSNALRLQDLAMHCAEHPSEALQSLLFEGEGAKV